MTTPTTAAIAVAHLSDPHLTSGALAAAPAENLHRALARVLTLDPRPDCVVITGDLVDRGDRKAYPLLHDLIDRYPLPLHLVAGNHDNPEALLAEFGGTRFLGGADRTHHAVDHPGFTVVVLDSSLPGSPAGRLGPEQTTWLDTVLTRRPEIPALVCLHHPPVDLGIAFLDGMRLTDGEELATVIARHGNVARVLAGHVHRPATAAFAGTLLTVAPSTHLQSGLALRGQVPDYLPEPTSFLLHLRTAAPLAPSADASPTSGWVTHTVPVSHAAATIGLY
ncbi:phosphodiesterase [Kitasatospora sp. NPDC096147]|uniref:phosphodiesterase n=1 Tax=Kitasatospora sp. NPDC096147 TaxID=3364093 RepID=UPI00382167AF